MKKFLAGFITCLILTTGVYAASTLKATPASFKILLNGNEFKPNTQAVVINGRTMLGLRDMAEALGIPVNWNEEERRVEIGETVTGVVYATPEPTVTPVPTPKGIEKNTFITDEKPPRFKITVLGQLPSNKEGFEVWSFRVENISVYNSNFRGSGIGANFGAKNSGFEAQYLKENPDYKVIPDIKLKPGEVITGIIGYQVNRTENKKDFGYNGVGVYYEE